MAYNYPRIQAGGAERPQLLDFNHIYKVLATSILETISPTRCVVCDEPGDVLCARCAASLPFIDLALACSRCGAPYGHALCTECPMPGSEAALQHPEEAFPFTRARAALSFEEGAKKVIRTYKDGDELRLDAVIASIICSAIRMRQMDRSLVSLSTGTSNFWDKWTGHLSQSFSEAEQSQEIASPPLRDWSQWAGALVYVPASPEALLRRGFDHMERVARIVAQRTGLPLVRALESGKGAQDQRNLGRSERLANRSESFSLADSMRPGARRTADTGNQAVMSADVVPRRIILIDDVFTTGATLSAATRVLLGGGAHEVRVVTCCRVW